MNASALRGSEDAHGALPSVEPLTVKVTTAIRLLGLGRTTIYQLIKTGALETSKVGSARLIHLASIRRLIDAAERHEPGR